MKTLYKVALGIAGLVAVSCTKYDPLKFHVDKPEEIALQEEIDAYPALKSYIDRTAHPKFKLGAALSLNPYVNKTVMYRLANYNFDEIVMGYEMKHGAVVQSNGNLALDNVENLIETAKAANIDVFGHTLMWHSNQNAAYLKQLIAPTIIPSTGGPSWDLVTQNNFETADAANYESNQNAVLSFTAAGAGFDGTGRALKISNASVRTNDWDAQFFVKFSPTVKEGERYTLKFNVKADVEVSFPTQAHTAPGSYKHWDFFGAVTAGPTWSTFTKEITVTADMANSGAIAFNLGKFATSYYFDNLSLTKYNPVGNVASGTDIIADFDADNLGKTYPMSSGGSGTVVTDPKGTSKVINIVGVQTFPKFTVNLPQGRTLANYQTLTLDFYATGSTGLHGQGMRLGINGGTMAAYPSASSQGSPDGDWSRGKIVLSLASLNLTSEQKKLSSFTLEVGSATGSANYYIDNITMQWKMTDIVIEKTDAEKKAILTKSLDTWIAGMLGVTNGYVKAWDVVNEPMDDGNPYELKTAAGRATIAADEFFWQDYLGKDYAVTAFNLARKYGSPGDILFINDYNLEYSLDKCKGIIEYTKYIESKGAKVDGIGTQMHIDINSDKNKIVEMFKLLAATGKLIKVSELDIGLGGVKTADATKEQYQKQAEMYKFVIDKYFENIPTAQRYGITIWGPLDSPANSSWRAGEPIGIWNEGYVRKIAYSYVAEAIKTNLGKK